MAEGGVAHIDYVDASVDEGGHGAFEEVDHDLAGGCRFDVVIADGGGGVYDDDGESTACKFQGYHFSQELGALVIARHIGESDGDGLVADAAAVGDADAAHGAGIDEAFDAGLARGGE